MSGESSGTGASSSSGRSSPDRAHQHPSHAFSPFGAAFPRRSSTPAAAFLPPRFFQQQQQRSSAQQQQQQGQQQGNSLQLSQTHTGASEVGNVPHATPFATMPNRRTSFGTVLGSNRLSALTALGFGPSTPIHSPPLSQPGSQRPSASASSATSSRDQFNQEVKAKSLFTGLEGSAVDTSSGAGGGGGTPGPSLPSSPVQKPQRQKVVYLPGPDGICVENRSRRRSQA